jgi:uncharacterized protein (DUF885 family)
MTQDPTLTPVREVDAVAEQFVVDYAALDPVAATFFGIAGHDGELADLSPEGYAARADLQRRAREAAAAATPVDVREEIAQLSFLERADVELDQAEAHYRQAKVSSIYSELHELRSVFDLMGRDGEEQWSAISSRLAAVPHALDQWRATLQEEAGAGRISPRRQIGLVAEQVRTWTGRSGSGGDFFAALVEEATDVPDGLRTDLTRHAAAASAAFADTATFLDEELAPRGRDKEAVGREQYARDSRYFLGSVIDLDETYAWGWDELHRIETEMAEVAGQIAGSGASVADAVAALDADPSRQFHDAEEFRDWMQELADRTLTELNGTHFDIAEPLRVIECRIAPTRDGAIYYTPPSEDFTRPGRMWWSVPEGTEKFSPWREATTVFHEGVPGHHLQCAQAAYQHDLLNRWQRSMCWVSGHGEGWALYAERLMDELGYLSDPADRLGFLDAQGMRATRVVVDIGMHLELEIPRDNPFGFHPGERWTGALGLEFMRQHVRMDDAMIVAETNRYLGLPAQAPSYKVGERIWLQARDEERQRQGAAFDLKAFHREALDLGSLGLDPMREALARL